MSTHMRSRGFTLIEVMVVMVIIGILAAVIVPKIMNRPNEARVVAAKNDIRSIESALKLYRLDNGQYPTQQQGLKALVTKPSSGPAAPGWRSGGYLPRVPVDPWGKPYQYLNPGIHGRVDVFSYGPNGQSHGMKGVIGSWQL
ncbi:MAG: type II secretion system major pseudopilin GspG [Acidiferrobacter sp.]